MVKKEKVIGTQPGVEIVEVTYKNDTKVVQCFYDRARTLVEIAPGETKTWQESRPVRPVIEPVKEVSDGSGQAGTKG